ncbi:MAG: ParA family protein [Campylobacteraceae bacterium]|nr:ParA family protein [Campylobacteraceae bacterium]
MVVIYSSKGGVGKTSLAFSLAQDLDLGIITNDRCATYEVLKEKVKYMEGAMPMANALYDLGGFSTGYVLDVLNEADVVIIPATPDFNALQRALEIIGEIGESKVVVVANMIENEEEYSFIKSSLLVKVTVPIVPLKRSKLISNTLLAGQSTRTLYEESGLSKYSYRHIWPQYEALLTLIQKRINHGQAA